MVCVNKVCEMFLNLSHTFVRFTFAPLAALLWFAYIFKQTLIFNLFDVVKGFFEIVA